MPILFAWLPIRAVLHRLAGFSLREKHPLLVIRAKGAGRRPGFDNARLRVRHDLPRPEAMEYCHSAGHARHKPARPARSQARATSGGGNLRFREPGGGEPQSSHSDGRRARAAEKRAETAGWGMKVSMGRP